MHGCGSGSAVLVNAEVDSMGGVVDGGVGVGVKTSPRRAAIEKAQAELRQEYDVREERRRELDFLEKGGNPLDFKFGNTASLSVQSTSLTDQQPEHFVTSEAKGSFALTASPPGDSVESSGRPGVPTVCEPNSADNLLLFDGENELLEGERNSKHSSKRSRVVQSEHSSQMDGTQNAKESEDSAIVRPYARRNRSRINRDAPRSSSTDIVQTRHGSSLPVSNLKPGTSNGDINPKIGTCDSPLNMELDGVLAAEATGLTKVGLSEGKLDVTASRSWTNNQNNKTSHGGALQDSFDMASGDPDLDRGKEQPIPAGSECSPCEVAPKAENEINSGKLNGFGDSKGDRRNLPNDGSSSAAVGTKGLDSESSCTRNSPAVDVNNDNDVCINLKNVDSNGIPMEKTELELTPNLTGGERVNEKNEVKAVEGNSIIDDDRSFVYENHTDNGSAFKVEDQIQRNQSDVQELNYSSDTKVVQETDPSVPETDGKGSDILGTDSNTNKETSSSGKPEGVVDIGVCGASSGTNSATVANPQLGSGNALKLADKAHEDSILEEARIIEAKRKRIAELSVGVVPLESRRKSHWDFVLEEMAWLANDFVQERLWKMTAAAQICHRVAFTSRLRFEEQNQCWKLKKVAFTLADAVMQFWHSAEVLLNSVDPRVGQKDCRHNLAEGIEAAKDKETSKELEPPYARNNGVLTLKEYAVRFLKCNSAPVPRLQAEAPATPDRISDSGIMDISWDDHLTEESLFYAVPSGAMEAYRKSIESHLVQCDKTGSSVQEEVETSMYDAAAEFGFSESAYDEDEGETSNYYLPGAFDCSKSSKYSQKKRKNLIKSQTARTYELGADLSYGNYTTGSHPSMLMGKRPASNLNVGSIPTKRIRTASRQRVVSPFNAGVLGSLQAPAKTDASSGDTNSFQDDQSTLHAGSVIQKSVEVESVGDFDKQLPYDCAETTARPKKKKKAKHLGSAFEQGWQLDSTILNEQRDHSKKRLESHNFDSNGLYGQHNVKKPKIMKQSLDNTFDNIAPITGSIPSPVASQMSNMSNPNKFIKLIGGRDRGRKAKALKISSSQPGSGSPWSLFEDQALVVLVHDMGPNWELVSDAINSTLQFKCIYRKPKDCKERHKILMDRGAGDGADSAEDSGSSQSYPSTLPGIPKGSARQLFQRLQGPMEEDTLKSHFEKIIMIGKKQHYRRSQNDNQEPKQIGPVHNSHVMALSQVCPNNLNGGVLTPLDICDAMASSQDVLPIGYQSSHSSGLAISNQGAVASILPPSGANSSLQGSSAMILGSNLSSASGPLNNSVRYNVPRASLPVDEQHRMQQYNQMLSGRNMQQSNLSVPGAVSGPDRGVRVVPGGNGMGMMCGVNRGMPMSRPGFQGMASSTMLNSSSMLSSGMVGVPGPVSMHSGAGSGQGNSMLRSRESIQMIRPGSNPEHQRQLIVQELQMQVTQGSSQGIPAFNGLSSAFPNQTTSPPVQTYPGHSQQQHQISPQQSHSMSNSHHPHLQGAGHATGPQQQAYGIRLAKDRQMHQRYLQQQQQQQQPQQQQFAASGALIPHVQPQSQLPMSSSLQNSSQIQSQTSSQPVSLAPVTASSPMTPMSLQHQQKHHLPPHGLGRNPQSGAPGLTNQMGKQRQRQPQQQQQFQQSGRHHPQQRQQTHSQQQAKLLKGMGRGNMVVHQNLSVDPSHLNGLSMVPGNQAAEKGEQIMHLMQGQGLYSGSGINPVQPSKPLIPPQSSNHSQPQQKAFSGTTPSSKQVQQMPSHSDNSSQGQVAPSAHQSGLSAISAPNHQHLQLQGQPQQKQVNQTQPAAQRMLQQNRHENPDPLSKSQIDQTPVDPQLLNNASPMGTSATMPVSQASIDSASVVPIVASACTSQWKASESIFDSGMPNTTTKVGSIASASLTNAAGIDPVPSVSQGLGQRQLSGGLSSHGHNAGAQWQQQPQLQQSAPPPQQHYQPPEPQLPQQDLQQSPQQQPHQQVQHLQPASGSLYIRPSNSKVE